MTEPATPAARIEIFRLPPEVRFANARAVLEQALAASTRAFDLSACEHFDSSLIGVLLALSRHAGASGGTCVFARPPANLRKLASLYGVEALLFGPAQP
ncbi:MAG: STAS domain-containing protein [Burkholderiales bacterium]|nr:STAS domain-containing protein [Burkholderiales bacterium]